MDNPISVEQGLWGWAVTHDEALLCNAAHADPRAALVPDTPFEPQASIVLPLHVMNKVIGVLNLDRLGGKTYSEEEFELVKPFANLAAIAIENASLYEQQPAARRHRPAHRPLQPRPLPGDARARGAPLRALRRRASRCS